MSEIMTTPGTPPVRASDTERDQTAEILRAGYAEGRLSSAELDERLTGAYAATTRADLHALTSDLPGAVSAATPDQPAALPFADPESGTGMHLNVCLLVCLLFVCPPAGIAYWILAIRRKPQLAVPERSPLPGVEAGQ
jgi:hypothetical protein